MGYKVIHTDTVGVQHILLDIDDDLFFQYSETIKYNPDIKKVNDAVSLLLPSEIANAFRVRNGLDPLD